MIDGLCTSHLQLPVFTAVYLISHPEMFKPSHISKHINHPSCHMIGLNPSLPRLYVLPEGNRKMSALIPLLNSFNVRQPLKRLTHRFTVLQNKNNMTRNVFDKLPIWRKTSLNGFQSVVFQRWFIGSSLKVNIFGIVKKGKVFFHLVIWWCFQSSFCWCSILQIFYSVWPRRLYNLLAFSVRRKQRTVCWAILNFTLL